MPQSEIDDEQFEATLERWLGNQARTGTPELVLVGVLRRYADSIEERGHVPRAWTDDAERR